MLFEASTNHFLVDQLLRNLMLSSRLQVSLQLHSDHKQRFPSLFTGLGKLQGEYEIKLKEDTRPYAVTTPRRVVLPYLEKVKAELHRMESS